MVMISYYSSSAQTADNLPLAKTRLEQHDIYVQQRRLPSLSYRHSMICRTEGIKPTAPVKWRGLDGMMSVFWDAEGLSGAKAYYLSPDPRIVIFFNDVSSHISMSNRDGGFAKFHRPMVRAIYVPAGVPLWTNFNASHRFSHLDLHLHKDRLLRILSPSVGTSVSRLFRHPPGRRNASQSSMI
jgi:hypothetical protein